MIDVSNVELQHVALFFFLCAGLILIAWLILGGAITRAAEALSSDLEPEEALRQTRKEEALDGLEGLYIQARDLGIPETRYRYWVNKIDLKFAVEEYHAVERLLRLTSVSLDLYRGREVLGHFLNLNDVQILIEEVERALFLQSPSGSGSRSLNQTLLGLAKTAAVKQDYSEALDYLVTVNKYLKLLDREHAA
ncbi:TMhelix containing protein [Vibrio phage 1.215.B._10N.222.54.F7]|nr:TMhelix containing protein [Vibrio phage 1.215.A._10N.222.54.F7]AUR96062.1 TMhelix containing protein [Vibrio phage 1.215.B._10N.222.54.F7]